MKTFTAFSESTYFILLLLFVQNLSFIHPEGLTRKIDYSNDKRIIFAHLKKPLELKCPIEKTDDSKIYIDWHKGDLELYNEEGYTITNKQHLKIKSVAKHHAGTYTCEAINGYGFLPVNLTVIVEDPEEENENRTMHYQNSASRIYGFSPTIKKRPSPSNVHELGSQATFHCVASGQPTPNIFFFKGEELILGTESEISNGLTHATLRLKGLEKSDSGAYKCIARNRFGEDEVDYTVHVADPLKPPMITSLEPKSASVKEGSTAVFWCEVKSKPGTKLHIKWLKRLNKEMADPMTLDDVTLFRAGQTYYKPLNLSDGVGNNGVYKSKLTIRHTFKEDSGIYVCLALNDKGYNAKNATLTVISAVQTLETPSHFLARNSSFVATIIIALVIILAAIAIVIHFYCKGKKLQRNSILDEKTIKSDCENPMPIKIRKDIPYPEIKDLQSKVKLLCGDNPYNCEHTEHQISRTMHVKSYLP